MARPNDAEATNREQKDKFGAHIYKSISDSDRKIVDEVGRIAAARGIPRAQVAIAWLLSKSTITAPIVGATKPQHLADAVAALDVELTPQELTALEAPYVPHPVAGITW